MKEGVKREEQRAEQWIVYSGSLKGQLQLQAIWCGMLWCLELSLQVIKAQCFNMKSELNLKVKDKIIVFQ
jgi:hypothetical protein